MAGPELHDYILRQKENGHDNASIREHLINHGYSADAADKALEAITKKTTAASVKAPEKKRKIHLKAIAYAVLGLFLLSGLGFAGVNLFTSQDDIAGAATDAAVQELQKPTPVEPAREKEEIEEEQEESTEDEQEDTEEEQQEEEKESLDEEAKEDSSKEEPQVVVSLAAGCNGYLDCQSGYACYQNSCGVDYDRDGLADAAEEVHGTDRLSQDTDGDGVLDADEINKGYDPLNPDDPGYTACYTQADCASDEACSAEGICISCSDSDGENYEKLGVGQGVHYTNGNHLKARDTCLVSGELREFYCRPDNSLFYREVDCSTISPGAVCSEGVCA